MDNVETNFRERGVVIVEFALTAADLERMQDAFIGRRGAGVRHGDIPADLIDWLSTHPVLVELAGRALGQPARLTRAIAFDKTPQTNWFVPWHQDRSIAVSSRATGGGLDRWTERDGLLQVEPPIEILEQTVTLRIQIDDCPPDGGALEVIEGTHRSGRLSREAISARAAGGSVKVCAAAAGDIVVMSPLIVHRSRRARLPRRRRVLHLEFTAVSASAGIDWAIA
jgi:ectoine hydroxylase-related dioxygenase (phytanoyl-CoA dioxygenase family)